MQIAPGIDAEDWKKLKLDGDDPHEWDRAVSIFERRIRGRFMDAADFLIKDDEPRPPIERRWGFAVLTLDCLLVETLQAFREGLTGTSPKPGGSSKLCITFLTQREKFRKFFSEPIARKFYHEFRCGLMHNAQVLGTSRIWSVGDLLQQDEVRITVNRTAFHRALLAELDTYVAALRAGEDKTLRQNFRKKMDFIAAA